MSDMDKVPVLALERLRFIAMAHEMPPEIEFTFISKVMDDIVSGDTVCIWRVDHPEDQRIMQSQRITGLNLKHLKEEMK